SETGKATTTGVRGGLQRLLNTALGLLLISGFYNYYRVRPRVNAMGELKSTYHMVMGLKILLALAFFGVATAWIASRREGRIQPRALVIGIALAAVIFFLGATLRRMWYL